MIKEQQHRTLAPRGERRPAAAPLPVRERRGAPEERATRIRAVADSGPNHQTPDEAFRAGYAAAAPCEHEVHDPTDCPRCPLTDAEIAHLGVLLRGLRRSAAD